MDPIESASMRLAILALCAILTGCGGEAGPVDPASDSLARRRIALGLEQGSLDFGKAMHEMEERGLEEFLKQAAVGKHPLGEVRDQALRISNLLERIDLLTAGQEAEEEDFAALHWEAAGGALGLTLSAAKGQRAESKRWARKTLEACVGCHQIYRK